MLAIYAANFKFPYLIEGKKTVFFFTDHKPIACSFRRLNASNNHSPRQARQFSFIAEYIDEIHHLSGSENIVADGFKRLLVAMRDFSVINLLFQDLFNVPIVAFLFSASSMTYVILIGKLRKG